MQGHLTQSVAAAYRGGTAAQIHAGLRMRQPLDGAMPRFGFQGAGSELRNLRLNQLAGHVVASPGHRQGMLVGSNPNARRVRPTLTGSPGHAWGCGVLVAQRSLRHARFAENRKNRPRRRRFSLGGEELGWSAEASRAVGVANQPGGANLPGIFAAPHQVGNLVCFLQTIHARTQPVLILMLLRAKISLGIHPEPAERFAAELARAHGHFRGNYRNFTFKILG